MLAHLLRVGTWQSSTRLPVHGRTPPQAGEPSTSNSPPKRSRRTGTAVSHRRYSQALPPKLHPWLRPEAPPPDLPHCHALRRRLPVLPAARRALSKARWPMCHAVGQRLGP
jgi:hypothetical protein